MSRFFIVCLPRSRSAWLANLLSHESVMCLHEPLADGCRSLDDLEAKLASAGKPISGCADTALPFLIDRVIDRYPGARFVVLLRDTAGFAEQAARYGATPEHTANMLEAFQGACEALSTEVAPDRVCWVATKNLSQFEWCDQVWQFIGMPVPLNRVRFDMLHDMKVEVMVDRIQKRMVPEAMQELFGGE